MNERQLGRLFRRLVLLSAPVPLAMLGAACGGSSVDPDDGTGATAGSAGATQGGSKSTAGESGGGVGAVTGTGGGILLGGAGNGGGGSSGASGAGAGAGGTSGAGAGGGGTSGAANCQGNVTGGQCAPASVSVPKECVPTGGVVGGQVPADTCKLICGPSFGPCQISALDATNVTVLCQPGCAVGRRPAGLSENGGCDPRDVGSYFAEIAQLEAASVTAFRIMKQELRSHGAPKKLVRAAARAARDEIRHTRATGAVARRFGGRPRLPALAAPKPRCLEAMALENAIEGCVRETYGALVATHQAEHATDPQVRALMMRVARDETQHAALSWRVARWFEQRLDSAAKQRLQTAQRAAANELLHALATEPEPTFAAIAGLPSHAEGARLVAELRQTLWA